MISSDCDFKEFLNKIQHHDYVEILLAANAEATAAERTVYKNRKTRDDRTDAFRTYADTLKDFIYFLRNGIKPTSIRAYDFESFEDRRNDWQCEG